MVQTRAQSRRQSSWFDMHAYLKWDFAQVAKVQRFFGVTKRRPGPTPLYYMFSLGAALGNELFYILFLPFLFWGVDVVLARHVILLWVCTYYVGQLLKDICKLPRPLPPVVALEAHYAEEYGLPSTHAMAAISIPVFMALTYEPVHTVQMWPFAVAGACGWFLNMSASRIYMGVHSFADVVTGWMVGYAGLRAILVLYPIVDSLCVGPHASLTATMQAVPLVAVVLTLLYPVFARPTKWTNAFGDTTLIVGTAAGVYLAVGVVDAFGYHALPGFLPLSPTMQPTYLVLLLLRAILGYTVLLTTRLVFKTLMIRVMLLLVGETKTPPGQRYIVEIPTKLVTYTLIGFNAVLLVPFLFHKLGLHH